MSRKTKLLFVRTLTFMLVLIVYAGCTDLAPGLNQKGSKSSSPAVSKEKLRFWMRAATKDSVTGRLVDRYNSENKDNVFIEFEVFGENYKNAVTMAIASGRGPDIFELNGGLNVPLLAEAGNIYPIGGFVTEDLKKGIYPEALNQKQFYYKGDMYAIPERSAFFRLMYNKDIFRQAGIPGPPKTVEELLEYSKEITKAGNGNFYGFCVAMKTNTAIGRFTDNISTVSGFTGESGFNWSTGRFDFMGQKRALEVLKEMRQKGYLYPGASYLDIEVARVKFAQGSIGMMIDGNWTVAMYGNNEIENHIDWDSAPVPVFEGSQRKKSYIVYDMAKVIYSKTKDPKKAWNFIKYLLDNHEEYVKNGEPLRTTIKANNKENIPLSYEGIRGFTDIENSKASPVQVNELLTTLSGDRYEEVYRGIILGEIEINKGLEDLTQRYNSALEDALDRGAISEKDIKVP